MLRLAKLSWDKPALMLISSKCLDHMYRTQESAEFLNRIISLSPFPLKAANIILPSPPDKEGKKLDSYSRRLYSTGALGIKSCNYVVCMSRYIHAILEDLVPVIYALPVDKKPRVLQLCRDDLATSKQNITLVRQLQRHSLQW